MLGALVLAFSALIAVPVATAAPATTGASAMPPIEAGLAANQHFVRVAYLDFLDHEPTPTERDTAANALTAGTTDRGTFLWGLANSPEWVAHIVTRFYTDTLNRPPDQAGRDYWVGIIRNNTLSVAQVAASFYSSDEYFARYGNSLQAWMWNLYPALLGRDADQPGVNYWKATALSQGRWTVAYAFYQSDESRRARVANLYDHLLHRTPDSGGQAYWAGIIATQGDVALAVFLAASDEYYQDAQQATAPSAPLEVGTAPELTAVQVSWNLPATDGDLAITSYTATANPGAHTCTIAAPDRRCTITGLTTGTNYTITVTATNDRGTGAASVAVHETPHDAWSQLQVPATKAPLIPVGLLPDGRIVGEHAICTEPCTTSTPLGTAPGIDATATGVAANGTIYGTYPLGTSSTVGTVTWTSPSGAPVVLQAPTGFGNPTVIGILPDNSIVGYSIASGTPNKSFFSWATPAATPTAFSRTAPAGWTVATYTAVLPNGSVVGKGTQVVGGTTTDRSIVWDAAGDPTVIEPPAGMTLSISGYGPNNELVGQASQSGSPTRPFVLTSPTATPSLLPAYTGNGWNLTILGISNGGVVYGTVQTIYCESIGGEKTCSPNPIVWPSTTAQPVVGDDYADAIAGVNADGVMYTRVDRTKQFANYPGGQAWTYNPYSLGLSWDIPADHWRGVAPEMPGGSLAIEGVTDSGRIYGEVSHGVAWSMPVVWESATSPGIALQEPADDRLSDWLPNQGPPRPYELVGFADNGTIVSARGTAWTSPTTPGIKAGTHGSKLSAAVAVSETGIVLAKDRKSVWPAYDQDKVTVAAPAGAQTVRITGISASGVLYGQFQQTSNQKWRPVVWSAWGQPAQVLSGIELATDVQVDGDFAPFEMGGVTDDGTTIALGTTAYVWDTPTSAPRTVDLVGGSHILFNDSGLFHLAGNGTAASGQYSSGHQGDFWFWRSIGATALRVSTNGIRSASLVGVSDSGMVVFAGKYIIDGKAGWVWTP